MVCLEAYDDLKEFETRHAISFTSFLSLFDFRNLAADFRFIGLKMVWMVIHAEFLLIFTFASII